MRVENPRFSRSGYVLCEDCPLEDVNRKCLVFEEDVECPKSETYAAACLMAEEAAKGGKG